MVLPHWWQLVTVQLRQLPGLELAYEKKDNI